MSIADMQAACSEMVVPPHIVALQPYQPGLSVEEIKQRFGLQRVIKLASNENPLGVSPLALERAGRALAGMSRYPSGGQILRNALAESFGVKPLNVIVGSGSEGIMANIVRTFLCDDDEVLTTEG